MSAGFVYVLVNSSMPGLLKVGKTTRAPSERAAELSGATAVATPFIVAFEQLFADCDAAEQFVHTELQRLGMRASKNREFFYASTNEVIRIILQAPGIGNRSDRVELHSGDVANGRSLGGLGAEPWRGILESAEDSFFGRGDVLRDWHEALRLYLDAAMLGSLRAYETIGAILSVGLDGRPRLGEAVEAWEEGAKRGNYYCYPKLAEFYASTFQDDNALKCWQRFFRLRIEAPRPELESPRSYSSYCVDYIYFCISHGSGTDLLSNILAESSEVRREILEALPLRLEWSRKDYPPDPRRVKHWAAALTWARHNLLAAPRASQSFWKTVVQSLS